MVVFTILNVLLADDSEVTYKNLIKEVGEQAYVIDYVNDGISAIKMFRRNSYDILVLDTSLKELDGILVCKHIRKTSDVPIIFISSFGRESDKLIGFEAGGDDYLTKPFFYSELIARIQVLLKRSGKKDERNIFTAQGVHIDTNSKTAYVEEIEIALSPREYALLEFLVKNPNIAFSREKLLYEVWGSDYYGTDRTVDTHIKFLREKLGKYSSQIKTLWGIGYMLKK